MYGNKDIFKCWRTKELRDWKGRKGKMSSSKPRCLELYQIELSLGLNSWLQNIEKVIHIYNERLGLAEVSGRFSPLYTESCISLAFHDVSPWSPSLVFRCPWFQWSSRNEIQRISKPSFPLLLPCQVMFLLLCWIIQKEPWTEACTSADGIWIRKVSHALEFEKI